MPTPIAHSLVSLGLSDMESRRERPFTWAAFWMLLGNFADLDFLPGIILGEPSRFHHGATHSLLFAFVLAVVACQFYSVIFRRKTAFWIFLVVTGSHLFLDCLTLDTAPPYGLPLLWPFSHACFRFPFSLFLYVERAMSLRVLLSWHNFWAVFLEIALTLPFLLGMAFLRNGRTRSRANTAGIGRGKGREALSN